MRSIRTRLMLSLLIPLSIVAALVSLETFYSARKVSNDLNDRTLLAATLTILEHVISSNGNLLADATLAGLQDSLGDRFFYHVTGPDGAFVTGYSEYPRPTTDVKPDQDGQVYYDGMHRGVPVRAVRIQRDLTNRELNGEVIITTWQETSQREELTLSLFARSLGRLLLLVAAAGGIVWFAILAGLRPILRLQSAIESRTPYDLTPIRRQMPKELSGIVNSMNELFARVARSKKNRERFIGDAAHQLRNPIAAIKVQAQSSLETGSKPNMQSGLKQILQVSDKSTDMINKMLSGATAHAMDRALDEEFDLSTVVRDVALDAAPSAFDRGQELSATGTDNRLLYKGNQTLLREAIANLIDNAIRHNPEQTKINVGLRQNTETIEIVVGDNGEMISDERFLELTQPFLTGSDSHTGSGLGLSIAKDIAKSHGGMLAINPKEDGKEISISLPRQFSPSA